MQVRRQSDGSYVPDPNWYPTDLVTVYDVYGRRHRVRRAHLNDPARWTLLPLYNQRGTRLCENPRRSFHQTFLHRDNLAEQSRPLFAAAIVKSEGKA